MKKFLTTLAVAALAVPAFVTQADDVLNFKFTGEDAIEHISMSLVDMSNYPYQATPISVTSETTEVTFGNGSYYLFIVPESGYKVTYTGSDATNATYYPTQITDASNASSMSESFGVELTVGSIYMSISTSYNFESGSTLTFAVEEKGPEATLIFESNGSVESYSIYNCVDVIDLEEGTPVSFFDNRNTIDLPVMYQLTPSNTTKYYIEDIVVTTSDGTIVNPQELSEDYGGSFVGQMNIGMMDELDDNENPIIPYAVVLRSQAAGLTVTVKVGENVTYPEVTLNFVGSGLDNNTNIDDCVAVTVSGNDVDVEDGKYTVSISDYNTVVTVKPASDLYILKGVTITNQNGETVDPDNFYNYGTFEQQGSEETGYTYTITLSRYYTAAAGMKFTFTVANAGTTPQYQENFIFNGVDLDGENIPDLVTVFRTNNIDGNYVVTEMTVGSTSTLVELAAGANYVFIQPENGYKITYDNNTATSGYFSFTTLTASTATSYQRYAGDKTLKAGDLYVSINTNGSTFENNVTFNFTVMPTPPSVTMALVKDETVSTSYLYSAIKVTNADTDAAISWGSTANNKVFDLPININVIPNQLTEKYILTGLEITDAEGMSVSLSDLETEYDSTVTQTEYEGGGYQYNFNLSKEAGNLTFTLTVSDATPNSVTLWLISENYDFMQDNVVLKVDGEVVEPESYSYTVEIAEDGTTFSVAPKTGYEITSLNIVNNYGQDVTQDTFEENGWGTITETTDGGYEVELVDNSAYKDYRFIFYIAEDDNTGGSDSDITTTIKFEGSANAYKNVMVMDFADPTMAVIPMESNEFTFIFNEENPAAYMIAAVNGASIAKITAPNGDVYTSEDPGTPEDSDLPYVLMNMGTGWFIQFFPESSNNEAIYTFTIEGGIEGNLPVYLAGGVAGSQVALPTTDNPLVDEDDSNVWTGEFIIQPNNPFKFYTYAESADNGDNDPEMGGGSTNPWLAYGPVEGNDIELDFTLIDEMSIGIAMNSSEYWILKNDNPWKVEVEVDMNDLNVTITGIEEVVPAPETPEVCPVPPVVLPADKSVLNSLSVVEISWAGYTVAENEDNENGNPTLNGKTVPYDIQNNKLYISVNAEETGVYTIFVPEGLLILTNADGDEYINGAINASYNVNITFETLWLNTPISVTPANNSNVEDLYEVVVEWELPLYVNPENTVQPTLNGKTVYGECEGNTLVFNFDALAAGKYTLVIPAMYVAGEDVQEGFVDVYYNRALTLNYVVVESEGPDGPSTGIAFVEADANGLYRVYSLTGANVVNTKDGSELLRLAKGMYIINGQKVIIR